MRINIVNVEKSSIPGKKYHQLEVAYKDDTGALKGKKIMSFSIKNGLSVLENAAQGDVLDVTLVEEKGYWNWKEVVKASGEAPAASPSKGSYSAPSRDFETAAERSAKQVYIVRQSSITAALTYLINNPSKKAWGIMEVIEFAKGFENYVFDKDSDAPQGAERDDNIS